SYADKAGGVLTGVTLVGSGVPAFDGHNIADAVKQRIDVFYVIAAGWHQDIVALAGLLRGVTDGSAGGGRIITAAFIFAVLRNIARFVMLRMGRCKLGQQGQRQRE